MRKAISSIRGSTANRTMAAKDVDEYLAGVPEPARSTLLKLRAIIRSAVPAETTEGISYRIPTFKYKGPLVGFAAFPDHCSFFLMSGSVLDGFRKDVESFPTAKGTIRFPLDKALPAALVKRLVKARIAEADTKKPG